jgi:hypothetical protein
LEVAISGVGGFFGEGKLENPKSAESAWGAYVGEGVEDAELEIMVGLEGEETEDVYGVPIAGLSEGTEDGVEEVEGLEDESA